MGNWMTVQIVGTVAAADLPALRRWVRTEGDWDRFHPLCYFGPSLCGLGDWTAETMDTVGNLAERDYSAQDVADALRQAVALAPSLNLKVHCGGDYESSDVVATVTAVDRVVTVGEPEKATLPEVDESVTRSRLAAALFGR